MSDTSLRARPTIYKGVQMRSRLEAGFAGWLDRMGLQWEYEPHAIGDEHGQYLPDFLVREVFGFVDEDRRKADAYIEVKPSLDSMDWAKIARAAVQIHASNERMPLFVVTPKDDPIIVWSTGKGWAPAAWVHVDGTADVPLSACLTIGALDPPFLQEWWS